MELILEIDVTVKETIEVRGNTRSVSTVLFGGSASGAFFSGNVIGFGADTQLYRGGECRLSARYTLEGVDHTGSPCRVFIENNSNDSGGLTPRIITDSKALSEWESARLSAEITPTEKGVIVRIYR